MNKRGFTMIEVLTVIVILSLLAGIAAISYNSIMNHVNNNAYERYRDTMHAEAIQYVANHIDQMTWTGNASRITLSQLNIEPIKNPKKASDLCTSSYVDVTRTRNSVSNVLSITYNVCLKCSDFDSCKTYEN